MRRITAVLFVLLATVLLAHPGSTVDELLETLTVHEWGTFTSVSGGDGLSLEWMPAAGPTDLPCFVDSISGQVKYLMRGRIRMETPVLYFYSPRNVQVDVTVHFPGGSITEWYPPRSDEFISTSSIHWSDVSVRPGVEEDYPTEAGPSHYYAARATDAAPLFVEGESEKLLFYRGVGDFQPSLTATVTGDGHVQVRNLRNDPIHGVILFENHGGRVGYRLLGEVDGEIVVEMPETGLDIAQLHAELIQMLVAEGLYLKEAEAMVETWRDSWFEEGARLFYIVPPARVDSILPLSLEPAPQQLERVFVGRMELLIPQTLDEVESAVRSGDYTVMAIHGRFLEATIDELSRLGRLSDKEQIQGYEAVALLRDAYATSDPCSVR